MKPIVVQEQVRLGPGRCLQLALTGMGYRLFRSMITVAILALAVAFLVHVVGHSLLAHRVTVLAYQELADQRAVSQWVTRLTEPDDPLEAVRALGRGVRERIAEYAVWAELSQEELERVRGDAGALLELERYLEGLAETSRIVLTGDRDVLAVVKLLRDGQQWALFEGRVRQMSLPVPLGDWRKLGVLVEEVGPRMEKFLERLEAGQRRAIERVRGQLGGKSPLEAMADPPEGLEEILREAGYVVEAGSVDRLRSQAQVEIDRERLARLIQPRVVRDLLARRVRMPVALVNQAVALDWLRSRERAEWLVRAIEEKTGQKALSPERLLELARLHRRTLRLQEAVGDVVPSEAGGWRSLSAATLWLIALSFLVCVVGVANAMLMSVTERFTEIATMKCLGALDGFVMQMFLFEAMVQGLVGGVVGAVLGLVLAVLRAWAEYGNLVWPALDVWEELATGAGLAVGVGVVLAAVAAVWPAWVASRLAPMEAMRVE